MSMNNMPVIGIVERTRKSPFYDSTVRWGVKGFSVYNHMLMPIFYDTPEADYWHLINNVTLWDVAVERQVELMGPDAFKLARLMTPRNLAKCRIGQCKYVPIVDENGGMINDPLLLRLAKDHFWLSLADSDVLLYAKGIAYGLGLDVQIREPDVSPLAVQGPNSDPVMVDVFGDWVTKLRFFGFRETEIDGIPVVIAKSGWSKQGGYEIYLRDGRHGNRLWDMMMDAGKKYGIAPATPSTIERVESGLLSYGNDMTLENNPFEIGLGKYCDVDQEFDFIGKAALRRIRHEGVTQKLIGLVLEGDKIAGNSNHWDIQKDGQPCGKLTTATYSPRLKQNIALAMLPIEHTEIGTQVQVLTAFGVRDATVTEVPFIK